MPRLPTRLRKLDAALKALSDQGDPMMLSQLDGYLAGILVCPDLIMQGEWLPHVWGGDGVFENEAHANEIIELVMQHYNSIVRDLERGDGRYTPLFDVHGETDEIVCIFWLMGFMRAMSLRPDCWLDIAKGGDDDAATALSMLVTLADPENADEPIPDDERDELLANAPDMIPYCVEQLHHARLRSHEAVVPKIHHKVGRNEPCPCGSGKKYKRCCGLNC